VTIHCNTVIAAREVFTNATPPNAMSS